MSKSWDIDSVDIKKFIRNTLVFIAPLALIYISSIAGNINESGLSFDDFRISQAVAGAIALYLLNVLTDFFSKLVKDNTVSK